MRKRRFKSWRLTKWGGAPGPGSGGSSEDLPGSNSESNQPSLFAGYSVVNEADFEVQRDLEDWIKVAASNITQAQTLPADSPLRVRIQSNARLISTINDDILFEPESFRGVRDLAGNLQAAAIVNEMLDHLYLHYIATAPWNVTNDSPRSISDAGKALMVELVKESISNEHEGKIMLNALSGAVSFYQTIGFVFTGEGSASAPEMELTSEAAREVLRRYNT